MVWHPENPFWRALRPGQWTKNLLVLAPFMFALGDRRQLVPFSLFPDVFLAGLFFCVLSSGMYVFNDIIDRELDRRHPVKRNRPVASGAIGTGSAWRMATLFTFAGVTGSLLVSPQLAGIMLVYIFVQAGYTLFLKHIALVDVFVVAFGFVIRAVAGGVAASVEVSYWLLICTFLMALFLGLCKRRNEKEMMEKGLLERTRPSLGNSDTVLLDQLIAITASATVVSYAVYTQWPETVDKFGTRGMGFTIPFVVFGIFRYIDLVYRHSKGDRPEDILLTDVPLIINIALYLIGVAVIFLVS